MTTFCVLLSVGAAKGLDCCRVRKLVRVSSTLNAGCVYDTIKTFKRESILQGTHNAAQHQLNSSQSHIQKQWNSTDILEIVTGINSVDA